MIYANHVEVQIDAHEGEVLLFLQNGFEPGPRSAFVMPRRTAEILRDKLVAALQPREAPARQELPLTDIGDFGAEHEQPNTATGEWRERFGVQS